MCNSFLLASKKFSKHKNSLVNLATYFWKIRILRMCIAVTATALDCREYRKLSLVVGAISKKIVGAVAANKPQGGGAASRRRLFIKSRSLPAERRAFPTHRDTNDVRNGTPRSYRRTGGRWTGPAVQLWLWPIRQAASDTTKWAPRHLHALIWAKNCASDSKYCLLPEAWVTYSWKMTADVAWSIVFR